jgi:hypothetical protein
MRYTKLIPIGLAITITAHSAGHPSMLPPGMSAQPAPITAESTDVDQHQLPIASLPIIPRST